MRESYCELLTAVDNLLSYASGIEPVAIEPTPNPNNPGCEFRPQPGAVRLTDAQEAGFEAREHRVIRLAECCGLSERITAAGPMRSGSGTIVWPKPTGWCKTGFSGHSSWLGRDEFTRDLSDWRDRIGGFRMLVAELAGDAVDASDPPRPTAPPDPTATGRNEARDKWIYQQCYKGTEHGTIIRRLKRKPKSWARIESVQGIRGVVKRYCKRHNLAEPPKRQKGRKPHS